MNSKIKMGMDRKVQQEKAEKDMNSFYAAAFNTPAGQEVLKHLENELKSVMPLGASELEIIHREGGRFVLNSIINRTEKGRNND